MRLLILANSDSGLYKFRKELLEFLLKNRYEVFVSTPDGDFIPLIEDMGCIVIETKLSRRSINPIQDFNLMYSYWKMVKAINPDIVLTYTIKPNTYGGITCELLHIPYLTNVTGLGTAIENEGLVQRIALILYKIALNKASCVFFQNNSNLNYFKSKRIFSGRAKLLPGSGVNTSEFSYETYPCFNRNEDVFLFVGRIMKDKGIEELLSVAMRVKKVFPNTTFNIVGKCDEDYSQRLKKLESENVIKYWGRKSDVHEFYKECSALILPSYHEGMSNVLLEASSTGRPVLASNVPGCQETFVEGVTGFGFEAKNEDDLFNAIIEFISLDYNKKEEMGKAAREKMLKEFDRNKVVEAYMEEINRVEGK